MTVARQGECQFGLAFWTDTDPPVAADLSGVTVRITVDQPGTDLEWDATVDAGVATWSLDGADTDLPAGRAAARLLLVQGSSVFVAATGDLVVVP